MARARGFVALSVLISLEVVCPSREVAARVLSYSPVTTAYAIPAIQKRTNRYYLLIERDPRYPQSDPPAGSPVLHDSTGVEPPRVLLPLSIGQPIASAAYREDADGTQQILLLTTHRSSSSQSQGVWRFLYSRDGGRSFVALDPDLTKGGVAWQLSTPAMGGWLDTGGPTAMATRAGVRPGTKETPFVFVAAGPAGKALMAVSESGQTRTLHPATSPTGPFDIVGSDAEGSAFLLLVDDGNPATVGRRLVKVSLDGSSETLLTLGSEMIGESFLSASGGAYLRSSSQVGRVLPAGWAISYVTKDRIVPVVSARGGERIYAVPTAGYDGAWIVERETARPTVLYHHAPATGLVEQFRDLTGPDIEAVHAGASGELVLIQINRLRAGVVTPPIRSPALALWRVGDAAPRRYDELPLVERTSKEFLSLDVDRVAEGGSFIFDGGQLGSSGVPPLEPGVVRASLAQRLVIPAVARAAGAFGSFWRTDVHVRNPERVAISVSLRYAPTDGHRLPMEARISLDPGEIRVLPDVLHWAFGLESGSGVLFLTPPGNAAVEATSRTYTEGGRGTFGTGIPAIDLGADVITSASAPALFSGAFQGDGYRTNLVAAGTSARDSDARAELVPPVDEGSRGASIRFGVPGGGHAQVDGLADLLGLRPWQTGALRLSPESGEVVGAVVVIDNGTNDPTLFPPDAAVPAGASRTIPAIVHVDGANQARFRSDLFLTNPSDWPVTLQLTAVGWSPRSFQSSTLALFPRETRIIRDVLSTAFGGSGVATLNIVPQSPSLFPGSGVRVMSRTYALTPQGSFGFAMPPFSSSQRAQTGDELEILGISGGGRFRTNLAIVGLSSDVEVPVLIDVLDERGTLVDEFEVRLAGNAGLQIDDLFRARGLGDGPAAALIRIRPLGGTVGAYATLIDNGTNDPVYLPANLASRD